MPQKKKLSDIQSSPGETLIEFEYGGRNHSERLSAIELPEDELTPENVRFALNRAPAKFAYWSKMAAQVADEIGRVEAAYEFWFAEKYKEVTRESSKGSETYKKYLVMTTYPDEYRKFTAKIRTLAYVKSRVNILVKAFEMQSWTLQTLSSSLKAEFEQAARD